MELPKQPTHKRSSAKDVLVTPAQVAAAQALVERGELTGHPAPEAVRRIAGARALEQTAELPTE